MQKKVKIVDILLIVFFCILFIYFTISSARNIVTFIFGETVELSPDKIYVSASDDTQYNNYSITYNSGGKLVHENIHLSVIETFQLRRNNGFMNFEN